MCMASPSERYKPPFKTNDHSDLAVPLCSGCASKLRLRWWKVFFVAGIPAFFCTGLLAAIAQRIDWTGRLAITIGFGSFLWLVAGVVAAGMRCRPYKIVTVDADRGVFKFAASNRDYTDLCNERLRELDSAPTAE